MINELIFILHASTLSVALLLALRMGKEALIALICLYGVLANLFVTKQIALFSFDATASDAYIVAAILGLNILQEYFGTALSKKTIWVSFFCLITYTIATQLHLWYMPTVHDFAHEHFKVLLGFMPRITIASIFAFLVVQQFDRWLYGILQKKFGTSYFLLRNAGSIAVSQGLDTVLFSMLGLYGIVDNIVSIMLVSYIIKLCAIALTTPWMMLSRFIAIPNNLFNKP